jgi:glycerol-3-phosphate dehydrogenase
VIAVGAECGLLRPLVAGRPFLEAEVVWAVRHELALSVDDVLSRRLRLSPELPDRGEAVAPRVAQIMGRELGWGETRVALEAEKYLRLARREYAVAPPA